MNTVEARNISNFTHVLQRDNSGKPKVISVPGHGGRQYEVIIRRDKGLSVECRQAISNCVHIDCKGNSKSICYHSLAAILTCAKEQSQEIAFCETYQAASKLLQLRRNDKPVIVKLTSWQSKKAVWLVVTGVESKPEKKQMTDDEFRTLDEEFVEYMQARIDYQNDMRYGQW